MVPPKDAPSTVTVVHKDEFGASDGHKGVFQDLFLASARSYANIYYTYRVLQCCVYQARLACGRDDQSEGIKSVRNAEGEKGRGN